MSILISRRPLTDTVLLSKIASGNRNAARRNGGLEIWQRGAGGAASFAVAASGGNPYTADGWYLGNGANQASVVSQQAGLTNGSQWCAKIIRNSGQTGTGIMNFGFPLDTDELYPLLGQFIRLSFTAKAGANWSPTSGVLIGAVYYGTGTPVKVAAGFTGLTNSIGFNAALTTSATRFQGASAAVLPTTARQVEIYLFWTPVGTAGADDSVYIDDVQLEIVPAASQPAAPFEQMNFGEQLMLCQRHFYKTFLYGTAPAQNVGVNTGEWLANNWAAGTSAVAGAAPYRFAIPLRGTPATPTTYNPANTNAQKRDETAAVDQSALAITGLTAHGFYVTSTGGAGGVVGGINGLHFIADAGI